MDSSQRASRRPAGFDVPQETFENRVEVAWRFPEGRVPQPGQAMTVPWRDRMYSANLVVTSVTPSRSKGVAVLRR